MKQFDVVQAFGGPNGMLQYAEVAREWESQLARAKGPYDTVVKSVAKGFVASNGEIQKQQLTARLEELAPVYGHIPPAVLAAGKTIEEFRKDVEKEAVSIRVAILNSAPTPAAEAAATDAPGL